MNRTRSHRSDRTYLHLLFSAEFEALWPSDSPASRDRCHTKARHRHGRTLRSAITRIVFRERLVEKAGSDQQNFSNRQRVSPSRILLAPSYTRLALRPHYIVISIAYQSRLRSFEFSRIDEQMRRNVMAWRLDCETTRQVPRLQIIASNSLTRLRWAGVHFPLKFAQTHARKCWSFLSINVGRNYHRPWWWHVMLLPAVHDRPVF